MWVMTENERYGIAELAALGGVTRRTVRYYVQQGLLPAPLGVGRGRHYGPEHLARLQAAPGSKDEQFYRCLQLINNKLDFLIDQVFLKSAENPPRRDEILEISGSGLKFFSKAEIEAGALLKMNLILPGAFQFQIDLIAEVLRIEPSGEGRVMAAKIVEIDDAARDAIIKIVFHKQRQEIRRKKMGPGDDGHAR